MARREVHDEAPISDRRLPMFAKLNEFVQRLKNYSMPQDAYEAKMVEKGLYPDGTEHPDPVPMYEAVDFIQQPSMFDHVRSLVASEILRREALAAGAETFEEADDFDFGDEDDEPLSAYQNEDSWEGSPEARAVTPGQGPAEPARETLDGAAAPQAPSAPGASAPGAAPAASVPSSPAP